MIQIGEKAAEEIVRTVHYVGVKVGGKRGSRVANRITEAAGLGRIEMCDDLNCTECEPTR